MKTLISSFTAIAILFVFVTGSVHTIELCKQGNATCVRDCLHQLISNLTYDIDNIIFADSKGACENIIISFAEEGMLDGVKGENGSMVPANSGVAPEFSSVSPKDSGVPPEYSFLTPEDPYTCILLETESVVSIVLLAYYSETASSYTILSRIEELMKSNLLVLFEEAFCGIDQLSVIIAVEVGFRANCSESVVETFRTFEDELYPQVDYNVVTQDFMYFGNESGIFRQTKHTQCWFCDLDSVVVLVDSRDVILDDTSPQIELKILVATYDDKSEIVVYYDFIKLANGSFVVCSGNDTTDFTKEVGVPPLHTSVSVFLFIPLVIVSLISLTITFITYCTFDELRNLPGKITMNFIVAIFCALSTAIIDYTLPPRACTVAGPIFHYLWLAAFTWMNALSISITRTLTRTAPNKKSSGYCSLFMYMLYGWGAPLGIVAIPLTLHLCDCTNMVFRYDAIMGVNGHKSCWIVSDDSIGEIVFFTVIVAVLLGSNVFLFCYTVYKLRGVTKGIRASVQSKKRSRVSENLIFLKITILTGLPWILEFPAVIFHMAILDYFHVVLNALQGLFVFLVLVFNARVRRMWWRKFQKLSTQKKIRKSTSSSQEKQNVLTKNTSI